jgi:hypothetical protein
MQLSTVVAQAGLYENPDPWTYVTVGYTLCILGIVGYAGALVVRGRRLARQVPPEQRRWVDSAAAADAGDDT